MLLHSCIKANSWCSSNVPVRTKQEGVQRYFQGLRGRNKVEPPAAQTTLTKEELHEGPRLGNSECGGGGQQD